MSNLKHIEAALKIGHEPILLCDGECSKELAYKFLYPMLNKSSWELNSRQKTKDLAAKLGLELQTLNQ